MVHDEAEIYEIHERGGAEATRGRWLIVRRGSDGETHTEAREDGFETLDDAQRALVALLDERFGRPGRP